MTRTYEEWGELLELLFKKTQRNIYFDWTEERSGQKARIEHHQKTINKLGDCANEWRKLTEKAEADKAKLVEALTPLAELKTSDGPYITAGGNLKEQMFVRVGDIRRARAVLKEVL